MNSASDSQALVTWTVEGSVATITIDNPPLNILSWAAKDRLAACLDELWDRDDVRAVVLTGGGDRAFSVGSDVRDILADRERPDGADERARREHVLYNRIAAWPKPSLAAIHGYCLGGGLELALACDIRIAGAEAQLGLPEVKLGVFPSGGGTERLPRLVGSPKALELMYLGEPITAGQAFQLGLVNRVVPRGKAKQVALDMARTIAGRPHQAIRAIREVVLRNRDRPAEEGQPVATAALRRLFTTADLWEGIHAFLEKRPPQFQHR